MNCRKFENRSVMAQIVGCMVSFAIFFALFGSVFSRHADALQPSGLSNGGRLITPTVTPTPSQAMVFVQPVCMSNNSEVSKFTITVAGIGWPTTENINLYWQTPSGNPQLQQVISMGHPGSFQVSWTIPNAGSGAYHVIATTVTRQAVATYQVPCLGSNTTATPTPTAPVPSPTPAPSLPDLVVVGVPTLVSPPPIVAYQPVTFNVEIKNVSGVDINASFFVDLFIDPPVVIDPSTTSIPVVYSSGYIGIASLAHGESRVVSITASLGFANLPTVHKVYAIVDSTLQIQEALETNNISAPAIFSNVIPAPTPSVTPIPSSRP